MKTQTAVVTLTSLEDHLNLLDSLISGWREADYKVDLSQYIGSFLELQSGLEVLRYQTEEG